MKISSDRLIPSTLAVIPVCIAVPCIAKPPPICYSYIAVPNRFSPLRPDIYIPGSPRYIETIPSIAVFAVGIAAEPFFWQGKDAVAISTVCDPSGSGRVDMLTGPVVAARAAVAAGVKSKHMYLIRGSVGALALFLPIRRRIK